MKPYLKLCAGLPRPKFTLAEARKTLGVRPGSAKVVLSRMKSAGLVLSLGRGNYRLIGRENLVKMEEIRERDRKLYRLAQEIYRRYPDLKAIVLYGSRISGGADTFSDYDVMVITEEVHGKGEKKGVERELAERLGARVHLTVYSEKGFRKFIMTEPHIRFWLNDAVVLAEGRWPGALPPTAKWGYKEALHMAGGYIDVGDESRGARRATYYLTALKIILMVGHALKLDYDYENVRREMEDLAGKGLVMAVRRNHISPRGIGRTQVDKLGKIVRKRLGETRSGLEAIGENESDLRWKELRK